MRRAVKLWLHKHPLKTESTATVRSSFLAVMILGIGMALSSCRPDKPANSTAGAHGSLQVQNLLSDRLQMNAYSTKDGQKYVTQTDSIYQWAARQFDGEVAGVRVFWDSIPPEDGQQANHSIGFHGEVALVRLLDESESRTAASPDEAFEEMWMRLVYELVSFQSRRRILHLYNEAKAGRANRDEFVKELARTEFDAIKRTEEFWSDVWKPWSNRSGFVTREEVWFFEGSATFEEWYASKLRTEAATGYPGQTLGRIYDWLLQTKVRMPRPRTQGQ